MQTSLSSKAEHEFCVSFFHQLEASYWIARPESMRGGSYESASKNPEREARESQARANQPWRDCAIKIIRFRGCSPVLISSKDSPDIHLPLTARALTMGILEAITAPLAEQISQRGMGIVVAAGFATFLVLAVVLNVLNQLLFKNPHEPPVVFHWFPIIGSTVTYGIDPYKFFFENRAKVSAPLPQIYD
jgi:hypothetical protein